MKPILKNILAILAGFIFGSIVNMGIIMLSGHVIPPPEGADVTTMEGLAATMHLFQPKHFIFPFLAHALGTFAGAFLAAKIASNRKLTYGMVVGVLFLAGGSVNVVMLPSPLWFTILDLTVAYLPMAYFGGKLAYR
ncbi:MAG: hypothetical protein ACK40G_14410 [Cytophagaceae bacterium]